MTDALGLWIVDGYSFGWSTGSGVVALPRADEDDAELATRQAELEALFAQPAMVPASDVGPGGELIDTERLEGPGTLEHAAAVARGLGARREL